METNENLTKKLKYIGLDLENVSDKLNFFQNMNFKVHKNYTEKNYKVYKYLDVSDIEIFLTPTHRLTDYTEKCAKALPIGAYLYTDSEESIERNIQFLNLLKNTQIEDIEELEIQQKELNKNIPYTVNYSKDYLWQIYYSEVSKKYFMLAPIKETENSALFYVIKKKLENKEQKIYVPICYANYSEKFMNKTEMEEIERYICFFTKDWPLIYDVYDKNEKISMKMVGKTLIYDTLKSEYKVEFFEPGEAEDFYKLIKVLFILETQLSQHYKFNIKLDKKGYLHFYFENEEIKFEDLVKFIKKEYIKGLEKLIKTKETKINLGKRLKKLKNITKKLDEEYYEKEKQISTFLECKKSFLGKVKYFIKYKKKTIIKEEKVIEEKEEKNNLKYCERTDIKEAYTLEELLSLYMSLDTEINSTKDLELDIEAIEKRIDILKLKIKNATLYIKEIDEHKKSIFEFWKFTNKDNAKQLNQGNIDIHKTKKLKKVFNYLQDFEDLSKQFDKNQRENLSKEETDHIFIATTNIIYDLNDIENNYKKLLETHLDELKNEMQMKDYDAVDIFGSISSSRENAKTLGNIKHRESEKNKFAILNLKEKTSIDDYEQQLKAVSKTIRKCLKKNKSIIDIPVYKSGEIEDGFNVFYINPENALNYTEGKEIELHKFVLKEGTNCLAFTNIIYYNNTNQTLPVGMNVTDGILIDTKNLKLELVQKSQNYIIKLNGDSFKATTLKLNIYEYKIC